MSSATSPEPARLAIFSSHPIQYQVPWFQALAQRPEVDVTVYYAVVPSPEDQGVGFDVPFSWDIPMLEGYRWKRLTSASQRPSLGGFFTSRVRGLHKLLGEDQPDAAILTGWQSMALLQALGACRRAGVPRIVRGESNALRPRAGWKRFLQRRLLQKYDHFLAIGRSNTDFYLGHGIASSRISRCPYFVENERFRSAAESLGERRQAIRQEWSISAESTCFLFAGKLIPKKRPLDLLTAVRQACRSDTASIHLLIVGDGALRHECERLAERETLPVTFAGFLNQSEIARAYVASDCLVLPSDYGETWGLVVNEAMACGRPAIVSDRVGCGPDLVENGSTGFVFPFGDVHALADMLIAAATDRDSLARMGERGRDRVLTGYSVERAVEGTLRAIRTVLAERESDGRGPWSAPGSAKGGE